ncbi:GGGtGRT protein [Desulfosporosinus sp. PR]|uniref:GGGtGRT protein n=1 Tax=Candidatus Desulfosporosinus nitrosoreducens TaxID=3401928 RepID=UPI0027F65C1B|nr:GGGtGRT protein [Desulfosporosinus sp. PR]MDQ7096360.1 GGGtGRT protein [Desulfosporosinus sp. PR]
MFTGYEHRRAGIAAALARLEMNSLTEVKTYTQDQGIEVEEIVRSIQPISFDNAVWAFTLGAALALKSGVKEATRTALAVGEGLQAFTIPGSIAAQREVGLGHGHLAKMLLDEQTKVFAFVAGHESFAAAEGAMGVSKYADLARREPLKVVLIGLGKDAAKIIARVIGFTYVQTDYDFAGNELVILGEKQYAHDLRQNVRVYGANSVDEGVAIMKFCKVNISITGNSTNPTRFQHPVVGTYKKWALENGQPFFSVASGGGTGRTLHPDNLAAGPASYGFTDTLGRMHSDAQFAGSSSVPAHVDMMGFIGMGNNPIVGACVALAVRTAQANERR